MMNNDDDDNNNNSQLPTSQLALLHDDIGTVFSSIIMLTSQYL